LGDDGPAIGNVDGAEGDSGHGDDGGGGPDATTDGGSGATDPWISFDAASVVSRSNIVLAKPNTMPSQFMPVGNGSLGGAVWAASGITVQLNRVDTFPDRKSPGQVTIPGLSTITGASDFHGTLDLYNATLILSGGGMTARIYIRADSDELVVDVTGAKPSSNQTASVGLWASRNPTAAVSGSIATLAESWNDAGLGASTLKFGSLAAITAGGRNVQASANGKTATVTFQPNADGSFRVVCGSPKYNGSTPAGTAASTLIGSDATSSTLASTHAAWWHQYWNTVGLVKMTSTDGVADYVENLRAMYLYVSASQFRGEYPGSQAGIGDLFSYNQDTHQWVPQDYWFWNLRMQVAANLSSGAFDENLTIFKLYQSNVADIESWTTQRMGNRAGMCVPETMRFNGNGWYGYTGNQSCDETITPSYNSLTLSSGSEVGLWIWRQYLATQDAAFLKTYFPVMLEAARFLMAEATTGSDGKLHMTKSNAHETQWAVTDPITDISAMRALFPAVVAAAPLVASNDPLIAQLQAVIAPSTYKLPDFPRTNTARNQVTTPASDSTNIFAYSTQPTAPTHNVENLGLEPVWPYDLISDTNTTEFAVAKKSYTTRQFNGASGCSTDWTNDPIHAARLGLASEVASTLQGDIACYQVHPSGLAWLASAFQQEPYVEQIGVVTTAVNEALVQGFDGLLRVAPAWPTGWTASGEVYVQGKSKVIVQFQSGAVAFAVLEAGSTGTVIVRNPWNASATVIDSASQQAVVAPTSNSTLTIDAQQGHSYLIKLASAATPSAVVVSGTAATSVKTLGSRTIGVP
jgi:hypothetical protein